MLSAGHRPESVRLAIVIGTLRGYDTLRRALDGFSHQSVSSASFEVVVVVDAADPRPDLVDQAIGTRAYRVRRLVGDAPGASANRNVGVGAIEAPLILFTDDDIIPRRRLVAEHLAWHERFPSEEVAVLGRVRWSREVEITTFMRWLDSGFQFDYANLKGIEAGWGRFVTANVSLKSALLERVGQFDQAHFPYGYEDTDWAYRADRQGFRLVYNRRAVADHLRTMTLEFWQRRMRRIAFAEHTYTQLHPDMPPAFHGRLTEAMTLISPRGRALRLAKFVPRRTPWLGPRVWHRVDVAYKQALAPHFFAAWDEAKAQGVTPGSGPDLAERAESSAGSAPGGPK